MLERNKGRDSGSDKGEASVAQASKSADLSMMLMAAEANVLIDAISPDEWILDTGCSFHMTPRKELLCDFKELTSSCVKMGNKTYSHVKCIGNIKLRNPDGTSVILTDGRYMPEMDRNLISMELWRIKVAGSSQRMVF